MTDLYSLACILLALALALALLLGVCFVSMPPATVVMCWRMSVSAATGRPLVPR